MKFHSKIGIPFVLAALTLAGCVTNGPESRSRDYRKNHPIVVEQEDVLLTLKLEPGQGTLSFQDEDRLGRYIRDYERRGRSVMRVLIPRAGNDTARARVNRVREILSTSGLTPRQVRVSEGELDDRVDIAFRAYKATVPNCDNISWDSRLDPSNYPIRSFGCAYQRGLGLMIADPADIVNPRDLSGKNTTRGSNIIVRNREGQPTGSVKSAAQNSPLLTGN